MIAANYTAHLYCDCKDCDEHYWEKKEAEYTGKSWAEVATAARRDGWRISEDRTRAFAPGHKIKRNT